MKLKRLILAALTLCACSPQNPAPTTENVDETVSAPKHWVMVEDWIAHRDRLHRFQHGIGFEPGAPDGQKYLELGGAWLAPEVISPEKAESEKMPWAANRALRWLGGTTATFHFPLNPAEFEGDVNVHVQLRPKVNDSVAIMFYQNDDAQNAAWTMPKSFKLEPGWKDNVVTIPRDWLNRSGDQLMRLRFGGTYFEDSDRVAAKFVRIDVKTGESEAKTGPIAPVAASVEACRVDDQSRNAWVLSDGTSLERYWVVPAHAQLRFEVAPSAWLMQHARLTVTVFTDEAEPATVFEDTVETGSDWRAEAVDLSEYAGQAVRLVMRVETEADELFGAVPLPAGAVCAANMQVVEAASDEQVSAFEAIRASERIAVIAIDDLRVDRLNDEAYASVAPNLQALRQHAVWGTAMTESPGNQATTVSLLTGVSRAKHGVDDEATHIKTSLNTLAELNPDWSSTFLTTSKAIDPARGFAQGFAKVRQLNKEKLGAPVDAVNALVEELSAAPTKSLVYLHLGALRLPLSPSDENFARFAQPGYAGPVNAQAMQNVAVMRDPTPADSRQFAAYYDAALADLDAAFDALLTRLPPKTLVLVVGTHGCSLGESTLGYLQSLTPWEVHVPWFMASNDVATDVAWPRVTNVRALNQVIADVMQGNPVETIADEAPKAVFGELTATSTDHYFYRIKREGVDALYSFGDGNSPLAIHEVQKKPITRRALRERITNE